MNLRRSEWTKEKEVCANAARLKAVKTKPKRMKGAKSQTEGYLEVIDRARESFRDAKPKPLVKGVHWHRWAFIDDKGRYSFTFRNKPDAREVRRMLELYGARLVRVRLVTVEAK